MVDLTRANMTGTHSRDPKSRLAKVRVASSIPSSDSTKIQSREPAGLGLACQLGTLRGAPTGEG